MADVLHSSQGTPSFLHHLRTLLAQVEDFLRKVEVREGGKEKYGRRREEQERREGEREGGRDGGREVRERGEGGKEGGSEQARERGK